MRLFKNKKIALNQQTNSYFRKAGDSVSTLATKGLDYLVNYYKEHQRFALNAYRDKKITTDLYEAYITRFFNRVNNRLPRVKKLNLKYLRLRLKYKSDLKK